MAMAEESSGDETDISSEFSGDTVIENLHITNTEASKEADRSIGEQSQDVVIESRAYVKGSIHAGDSPLPSVLTVTKL
jgi:hypothetical protein